ncbi:DNA helicase UvrD [Candidatus Micrarchaeota archaeon]|nr:DNA helicase UvrD [Candidatus Micrarchaeota archaeon]
MIYADLHLHSKYSRAVSKNCDLKNLRLGALSKGLNLLATSDYTHPLWFKELKQSLTESPHEGFYYYEDNKDVLFVAGTEIANIYSDGKKVRKVHNLIFSPSLEEASQVNDLLSKRANLAADGRPIIGKTSSAELVEIIESVSKKNYLIPAHAWTPWFGVFGSKSGYDSLKEAFEDKTRSIFAIETGLSSDPEMNWKLSQLDDIAFISNSDAHSPHPWRLGRECNAFDFTDKELSYDALFKAIRERNDNFKYTIEVDPAYGKYHVDGHRSCGFSCEPQETKKLNDLCPKCGKPLVIGVLNRVEELADRPVGEKPEKTIPFKKLLPLHELVSAVLKTSLASKKVMTECEKIMTLGTELFILLEASEEELSTKTSKQVINAIISNRKEELKIKPGFDGEYGELLFQEP